MKDQKMMGAAVAVVVVAAAAAAVVVVVCMSVCVCCDIYLNLEIKYSDLVTGIIFSNDLLLTVFLNFVTSIITIYSHFSRCYTRKLITSPLTIQLFFPYEYREDNMR